MSASHEQLQSQANRSFTVAYICMFGAPILWSLGGLLIKSIHWNSFAIAGARSGIAALLILLFLRGKVNLHVTPLRVGAVLAQTTALFCFVGAMRIANTTNVVFLNNTSFIYVAILSRIFLKEKISILDWLITLAVLIGILLFFMGGLTLEHVWGNLLAIFSAIAFSICVILLRAQKDEQPMQAVFFGHSLAFLIGLPFILSSGEPQGIGWTGIVLLGVFQIGLAYVCFAIAIEKVRAFDFTLVSMLDPVLGPIWTAIAFHEKPTFWAVIGAIIVTAAVIAKALMLRTSEQANKT